MKLLIALFPIFLGSSALASPTLSSYDIPVCHDINGVPVREGVTQDPSNGPAFSIADGNTPSIFVNWEELAKYATSRDTVRFILEHECGHCALGHIYHNASLKKTNQQELDADCYAAKQAKSLGINIQNVLKDVDILPRDPAHPSGLVRGKNIQNCYNQ